MKGLLAFLCLIVACSFAKAQETGNFSGGLESNSQWLQDDDKLDFTAPEDQFRSNNYFRLNYNYKKFTAGVQYESYLPNALLGYDPVYDNQNGIATYFVNFKDDDFDVTAGYFYEQFGNGLMLRSWENRQLGINNALKGLKVHYDLTENIELKGVFGKQRVGFETSEATIKGLDAEINLSDILNIEDWFIKAGGSYVGRYQANGTAPQDSIPANVNSYGGRLNVYKGSFYGGFEYAYRGDDILVNEGDVVGNGLYDGDAYQLDLGYSQNRFGINASFRRLDNYSFFSDRLETGNQYNHQILNYVPALTKQQDYLLPNIYVYQSQPRLFFQEDLKFESRNGEVGTQWDIYYTFKKGSLFGGKYGTKLALNFSYWGGLETDFDFKGNQYDSKFIGNGNRYYRDLNLQVKKRWSKSWNSIFYYMNQIIDEGVTQGGPVGVQEDIKTNIGVIENIYRFGDRQSIRWEVQHLWTNEDRNNWAASVLEYNPSPRFTIYASDSWNYGGEGEIHYYSLGGSYSKGRYRVALNYGRQRGGLICVGGVCRFVPSNTGLTMNLTATF
jgi:hypothetical protein